MTYDNRGRVISLSDSDAKNRTTKYDGYGGVVQTRDGKLQTTTFVLDLLGRRDLPDHIRGNHHDHLGRRETAPRAGSPIPPGRCYVSTTTTPSDA